MPTLPLTLADIRAAAGRIAPYVHRTPVLRSSALDRLTGARLFFKCENLQRSGAFKFRGATNAVFSLPPDSTTRGVVTHSSGNHAAALAMAARLRGVPAHLVIPEGATASKVEAARREGARVVFCAPTLDAREQAATRIREETGAELVHPYNDLRVMAGQGTATLEFLEDFPDLDVLIVPVSGGGLASGTAVAATETKPDIRVIGVEPALANDAQRSLREGAIVVLEKPDTICDGLRASLGPLTFEVLRARLDTIAAVRDSETISAMRLIWDVLKLVVEPSAAITLAALLGQLIRIPEGTRVGLILSGGNVDLDNLPWTKQPN